MVYCALDGIATPRVGLNGRQDGVLYRQERNDE